MQMRISTEIILLSKAYSRGVETEEYEGKDESLPFSGVSSYLRYNVNEHKAYFSRHA